jgi:two-component system sensor histidine kinase BaeS/two-component system sensor histidine kinase AdeS
MDNALILIVEDEPQISEVLEAYFQREGFRTITARDGEIAIQHHHMLKPDLVVLDVNLPKRNGYEVLAEVRRQSQIPLTILRARLQAHYDGVFPWSNTGAKLLIAQVDALAHIIDDLQIVSLGATGQLALNQAPHDLSVLVASLVEGLGTSYALDDFKVETDLQVAIASIDPQRTRQLVLALAENARRHAKAGGLVRFETGVQGNQAVIKVLDRGPGLPVGHEQKIFERFWRADSSRDRVSGGSGLGLSVVSSLTKAQGGTVTAYNQKHGGAAFVVKFKAIK